MENFRTVTIVGKRNTYETLYIQYFLRAIGIECVAVDEQEEVDKKSDIIFLFGKGKKSWEEIDEVGRKNIFFTVDSNQDVEKMLVDLVSLFLEKNTQLRRMETLRKIYQHYHLIEIFYEYTGVCLEKLGKDVTDNYIKILYDVETKVEKLINETEKFKEAVIFFKYYLIEKINRFKWLCKGSSLTMEKDFDTEYILNHINEIYKYDEKYWQVEILKGEIAEYDTRFSAIPKNFWDNAATLSVLKQSKGETFYLYGKWKKRNSELFETNLFISKAVSNDLKNIKFYFELMSQDIKMEQNLSAIKLANDILNVLQAKFAEKEQMNLQDLEYLYKTYSCLTRLCEKHQIEMWEEKAEKVLSYIFSLEEEKNDFASKMYPNDKTKLSIIEIMISRCSQRALIEAKKMKNKQ